MKNLWDSILYTLKRPEYLVTIPGILTDFGIGLADMATDATIEHINSSLSSIDTPKTRQCYIQTQLQSYAAASMSDDEYAQFEANLNDVMASAFDSDGNPIASASLGNDGTNSTGASIISSSTVDTSAADS